MALWNSWSRCQQRSPFSFYRPRVEPLEDRTVLSFITAPSSAAGPAPGAVVVGDFNSDGIPDLAVTNNQVPVTRILRSPAR